MLGSKNQIKACASSTYSLAILVVKLRFAMPLCVLEIFKGRFSAFVLAVLQETRRCPGCFLPDQNHANGAFLQIGRNLQKFDVPLFVDAFEDCGHGWNPSMRPRHERRGEPPKTRATNTADTRFNAATAQTPWRMGVVLGKNPSTTQLQCGHGTNAVE